MKMEKRENLFEGLTSVEVAALRYEFQRGVAKTAIRASTIQVLFVVVLLVLGQLFLQHPVIAFWLSFVVTATTVVRIFVAYCFRRSQVFDSMFWNAVFVTTLAQPVTWVSLFLVLYALDGFSGSTPIVFIIMAGNFTATLDYIKGDRALASAFASLFTAPLLMTMWIRWDRLSVTLSLLSISYLVFVLFMIRQMSRDYWQRVVNQYLMIARNREKEEMQKRLFQADRLASLGTLAAGVAHEINNPLAIAAGYLEMTRKVFEKADPVYREFYSKIMEAINRIASVVEGMRIFVPTNDRTEVISVVSVLNSSLDFVETMFLKKQVVIQREMQMSEFRVSGNPGKLQQVIMNLLTNARDAMPDGGLIRVLTTQEGDRGIVSVIDNGTGIKPEHLGRIFDSFFTTKSPGKGTGLGLNISYSIIKDMGGDIRVQSTYGNGSRFDLVLPLVKR